MYRRGFVEDSVRSNDPTILAGGRALRCAFNSPYAHARAHLTDSCNGVTDISVMHRFCIRLSFSFSLSPPPLSFSPFLSLHFRSQSVCLALYALLSSFLFRVARFSFSQHARTHARLTLVDVFVELRWIYAAPPLHNHRHVRDARALARAGQRPPRNGRSRSLHARQESRKIARIEGSKAEETFRARARAHTSAHKRGCARRDLRIDRAIMYSHAEHLIGRFARVTEIKSSPPKNCFMHNAPHAVDIAPMYDL